jgi:mRNA-degrading endonuclease RelE of RelBE toxin-antitoxin system
MNYSVLPIPPFDRQLKRLAKKYPSLKEEYLELIESLEQRPEQGTNLGKNCYKIRLAIVSKGKGKSGGSKGISIVEKFF